MELDLDHEAEAMSEFLESELRHHVIEDNVVPDSPWMAAIFEQLTKLCESGPVELNEMSRLYDLYVTAERISRLLGTGW